MQRYLATDGNATAITLESLNRRDQEFVTTLIRAFEEEEGFHYDEFNRFSLHTIIDYIRRTHRLYLTKTLHEIEQSIGLLNEAYRSGHPLLGMLNDFYLKYKTDLIHHIRVEDEQLIPWISKLASSLNNELNLLEHFFSTSRFSLKDFLKDHHDNDSVLDEIRFKIQTYDPPLVNRFIYNVLLNQLEFFARDLHVHGKIEEEVLIPAAFEIEEEIQRRFLEKVAMN